MAIVILKATTQCNANCAYCEAVDPERAGVRTMPPEVLELFFVRANEFLAAHPKERLLIIWHGGEPLVLGPAFFERALKLQQQICDRTGPRIEHRLQSNLTLFSPRFAQVFREMGIFGIGTSYDPIPGLRGLGPKRDAAAYQARFRQGLRLLEAEGFGWGLICVVTKLSLDRGREIFRSLCEIKPDGNFKLQPVLLCGQDPGELAITPEEFGDFLGAVFPEWWANREKWPLVEPFRVLTAAILKGSRHRYCLDSGRCAASHIGVDPGGGVFQCGRALDRGLLSYGHLSRRSFEEILADPMRETLLGRNQVLKAGECRDCRFWTLCHGGCPLDAYQGTGSFLGKSPWCAARKGFLEKYFEPVTGLRIQPDQEAGI